MQANQLSDIMCRGAVVSSIQSANNTLTRGVSLHSRSGSAHGSIHGGGSHHGSHGAVASGSSAHGSIGCLVASGGSGGGSSGHLTNIGGLTTTATLHGSSGSGAGSAGMLANSNLDTGDYDVPHPHPYTHHYMQTSTSVTPPHSTMSLLGSRPGSAAAGQYSTAAQDSGSDSSQGCGSMIASSAHMAHMNAHFNSMAAGAVVVSAPSTCHHHRHVAHSNSSGGGLGSGGVPLMGVSGTGSLGRCSSRCHNSAAINAMFDDGSLSASGANIYGSVSCMGLIDQPPPLQQSLHSIQSIQSLPPIVAHSHGRHGPIGVGVGVSGGSFSGVVGMGMGGAGGGSASHHGSAGSGLSMVGGAITGGRNSSLGTIHNGHSHGHQYHHECIHYERLPIPVPIPTVPTQVLPSEEEIEPAYATGIH